MSFYSNNFFSHDIDGLALLPFSIPLALLVLIPFIKPGSHRVMRSLLMTFVAAVITCLVGMAIGSLLYPVYDFYSEYFAGYDVSLIRIDRIYLAATLPCILVGHLILLIAAAFIASIKLTTRYVFFTVAGGLISGWAMSYATPLFWSIGLSTSIWYFEFDWWDIVLIVASALGPWMLWSIIIFLSMYRGARASSPLPATASKNDT